MDKYPTNCIIGYVVKNKAYYIRCELGGYLKHTGSMLLRYYRTINKVRELVWLGDIRLVRSNIKNTTKESYYYLENKSKKVNVCNVYKLIEDMSQDICTEFIYLFFEKQKKWFVHLDFITGDEAQSSHLYELTEELIRNEGE